MKVRRKATFEAFQWKGDDHPWLEIVGGEPAVRLYYGGLRFLRLGDWVLSWPNGDRFVVDEKAFAEIHEVTE